MPRSIQAAFQGTAAAFQNSLTQRAVADSRRAGHGLSRAGCALRELYPSRSRSFRRCHRRAWARCSLSIITRNDFSIIALIGIVLLIGIVKKNAIMMIDFALEAEREQHMSPDDSIYQASLLRFRPIMMTTMAALLGGLPLALGSGTGSELRRPLGNHHRRRTDPEPVADALYDAGHLSLLRPPGEPLRALAGKGAAPGTRNPARSRRLRRQLRNHEYLRASSFANPSRRRCSPSRSRFPALSRFNCFPFRRCRR